MMGHLDAIIASTSLICVVGSSYYELHPMDEWTSIIFSWEIKSYHKFLVLGYYV